MRVLIGCEFSGTMRDAFRTLGHDAMSCDLLPTETPGPHYQGDVRDVLDDGWDLAVFHPSCTYLTNSGVRWLSSEPDRWKHMIEAAVFFRELLHAPIPRVAVENPVMHGYARSIVGERATQVVQPWMFGHPESKATGLWLRGLPPRVVPSSRRARRRSVAAPGNAHASTTHRPARTGGSSAASPTPGSPRPPPSNGEAHRDEDDGRASWLRRLPARAGARVARVGGHLRRGAADPESDLTMTQG